jgi:hypothetical protein
MKTSNKLLLGLFVLILLTITVVMAVVKINFFKPGSSTYTVSGKQTEEQRNVAKFNQIEVENMIKVNYTQDNQQRVVIKADSNLIRMVVSEVKEPIQVDISTDSINGIKLTAGGIFGTTKKMKVTKLDGDGSAGALFEVDGDFTDLKIEMSAGCVANFKGKCKNLEISCTAGSIFNANDLVAEYGTISASAGAVMNVNVTGEISVDANAGSVIKCSGKARAKNINISSGAQFLN